MSTGAKSKMWTPANIVTVIRILLIPVFVVVLLSPWPDWMPEPLFWKSTQPWLAALVFGAISATDALDGYLARSRNEVTDFGKFVDPLADKILVCAALLALVELQEIPSWIALVIVAREFIVSGLRMLAASKGIVIAASMWGKVKTVVQMAMIILLLLHLPFTWFQVLEQIAIWLALALTVISLVDYLMKNKTVLKEQK